MGWGRKFKKIAYKREKTGVDWSGVGLCLRPTWGVGGRKK